MESTLRLNRPHRKVSHTPTLSKVFLRIAAYMLLASIEYCAHFYTRLERDEIGRKDVLVWMGVGALITRLLILCGVGL